MLEKTEQYEARLVRKNHLPGTRFTGDPGLLARAAQLRRAGAPWLSVLDAGDGWLVTELDLSIGVEEIGRVLEENGGEPPAPLAPQVVAAAGRVMSVAMQAGRDPRCIRFDWRGALRLRPVAPPGGGLAEALLRLSPAASSPSAAEWDETRVTAFVMGWLGAVFPHLQVNHQEREAWVETTLPPALEEPLVADLDDPGAWRLVSDALLEQGHPRGALMALQLAATDTAAVRAHLRRHPWLLPMAGPSLRLVLERGFVARLHVVEPSLAALPALKLLLAHPALRFLRSIHFEVSANELPPFLRAVEAVGHRSVRELVLPRTKNADRHRERLQTALPRLERAVSRP